MPCRVLVVDDSAINRNKLTTILEEGSRGNAQVVGRARDGQEAIKLVQDLSPDVITLDLEMPNMDGFTFLRILQITRPTPVIVVSTDTRPHSVFQALELGALDFVAKPVRAGWVELQDVAGELLEKVLAASQLRSNRPKPTEPVVERDVTSVRRAGIRCVAVASSTGGPPAIQQLLEAFQKPPPFSVVIAQHMPPRFTEALAERLAKRVKMPVAEIKQADHIQPGHAYICPGGLVTSLKVVGGDVVARVTPPGADRLAPNADVLLTSVADVYGAEATGVVLTGMGNDGAAGAANVERKGGRVVVESPQTAVLPSMPQAALDACPSARQLRMDALCRYLANAALAIAATLSPERPPP